METGGEEKGESEHSLLDYTYSETDAIYRLAFLPAGIIMLPSVK